MSRFLDMLRGVLFHSSTLYFVFISGYLFHFLAQRKFDLRTYYRKKLLNVIVPYVILSVFFTGYAFFWYSYTGEVPRFTKLVTGCREFFQALLYGDVVLTYWYIPFIATIFLVSPLLLRLSEERFALLTLFTVWIPLLSRTLDLTYPPLLVIQVPLYLFPLCRGYHWGVTPVTVRHLHGAGEYMGLYGLFYLIVASFAPQLLDRVPVLLALLALDLIAGEDSQYGLYVKTVNGITADYDTDGSYWAFYIDGEYAQTGPGLAACGRLRSAAGRQGGADPHLSGRRQPSGGRPDRCIPVPDVSLPGPLRRVRRDVLRRRRRQ